MAVLSDRDIKRRMAAGGLTVEPFDPDTQLGDSSIDLRLGDTIEHYETGKTTTFEDEVTFYPGRNYLATTQETIALPDDLCADIKGRSSIGRKFVQIHYAGWVDCGYHGQITLEVTNMSDSPTTFPVGQRICQMVVHETKTPPEVPYPEKEGQKYAGQNGPTRTRLHLESDEYE